MRKRVLTVTGLALLLCLVALPTSAVREPNRSLQGPDYIVNSTADPGVGTCDATECTLREAITQANGDGKVTNVAFNIPTSDGGYNLSTGVWTIYLAGDLPDLTEGTTAIMGSTQTGNQGDTNPYGPEIAVNGASAYDCFDLRSASNTVERLAINECRYGILIVGPAHHNNIRGNYIGLDAQGTAASGNTQNGIYIGYASDNTVGGGAASARNIISGNGWEGVWIYGDGADRNDISGNYIGTDSSGLVDVGNLSSGVYISGGAEANQIGPDNIIAYNDGHGVSIGGSATMYNTVTQNSIHSNLGGGITLSLDGANGGIPAPSISSSCCVSISGTAPANSTVEIFTGPDDEGKTYLTNVSAEGDGDWRIVGPFTLDAYVTATAADASGNTSAFSGSVTPGTCHVAYVPIALKSY